MKSMSKSKTYCIILNYYYITVDEKCEFHERLGIYCRGNN